MKYILTVVFSLLIAGVYAQSSSIQNRADSLVSQLSTHEEDTHKIDLLKRISGLFRAIDLEKGELYAIQGVQLANKLEHSRHKPYFYYTLSFAAYRNSSFGQCVAYAQEGVVNSEENSTIRADLLNIQGVGYKYLSEYDKALEAQLASLEINKEVGNKIGVANNHINIGELNRLKHSYPAAKKSYEKAQRIFEELNQPNGASKALNNIGIVFQEQKKYKEAIEYLEKALKLRLITPDKYAIASILTNLGYCHTGLNEYEKAINYFDQSLQIREELQDKYGVAVIYVNYGKVYYAKKDYEKTIQYYNKAYEIFEELDAKADIGDVAQNLAKVNREVGQYEKALEYIDVFRQMDSIVNAYEREQEIEQIKMMYELKQKNNAISEMQKDAELKESKLQQSRMTLLVTSGGLLVVFVLSLFAFNAYRQKKKANNLLVQKNEQITEQKELIEEKNTEILDSINYAKRIQSAILPVEGKLQKLFPQSFVFFQPKDIVSGDFYWAESVGNINLLAVADCTGHGVPGALMSMLGYNSLQKAANEFGLSEPGKILDLIHENIYKTLQSQGQQVKDGMDISVCSFNSKTKELTFAGAMSQGYLVSGKEVTILKGDKMAIASDIKEEAFHSAKIQMQEGDTLYLFTDGFPDQFGGEKGKKYKYSKFKDFLLSINAQGIETQREKIKQEFFQWKGDFEQTDDVCVFAFRA